MIALDANGADGGPAVVAEGARLSGERVLVFGPAAELDWPDVVDAPVGIAGDEEPVRAVRSNPDASIVQAAAAVADGRAEALVSAGSTGPTLAAATLAIKRMRGVHRPALAVLVPVPGRPVLLLDAGANVEVRPEHLVQFAYMGAAFMEAVHGVERPRVGLLSVGEESGKGTPGGARGARAARRAAPLNFAGNVEGFDLPGGRRRRRRDRRLHRQRRAEGDGGHLGARSARPSATAIRSGPVSTAGGLLIRGAVGRLRDELDPEQVGGAILLGLRKPVVVAHGSFGARGDRQRRGPRAPRGRRADGRAHPRGARGRRRVAVRARW